MPPALVGLLSVPVGMWAGWTLFGRRAGLIAAVLFAFNAWLTNYAQETRMYELMALLGIVATVSLQSPPQVVKPSRSASKSSSIVPSQSSSIPLQVSGLPLTSP